MHSFITALAAVLPVATAVPFGLGARGDAEGCTPQSTGSSFEWTVEAFDYHASYVFTTPAHQNSWGYVNFTLANPALDQKASCTAQSSQLQDFFYGTQTYACKTPDGADLGDTSFKFSRPSGVLDVTSSWTCRDQAPNTISTITGSGNATLTLDCSDETWENPDWEMGQIYSSRNVKCQPVTTTIKPYEMHAVA